MLGLWPLLAAGLLWAGMLFAVALWGERPRPQLQRDSYLNLNGVWRCMKAELPVMVEGGGGAIVNTSSIFGLVGSPGVSAYVASKHGVAGLTRAAALEYGRYNIRVNAVCPGFTRTPMVDPVFANERLLKSWLGMQSMRRPGEPEEIAAVVVWLCSDAASFVTGSMLSADGGYTAR